MPRFTLPLLAVALLFLGSLPGLAPQVAAQAEPSVMPTPLASERPDRCEPNDVVAQACVLTLDAVSGPFTFLPDGDQDYFSINLGEQPGLALELTVRATGGLDVRSTVSRERQQHARGEQRHGDERDTAYQLAGNGGRGGPV